MTSVEDISRTNRHHQKSVSSSRFLAAADGLADLRCFRRSLANAGSRVSQRHHGLMNAVVARA
jgi:hypothetical protein